MVRPYEIWINGYFHMSGGIRALHVLKQELINRGIPAHMKYENTINEECIGVYPEIISDNPENYQRLCRWLLNTADLPNDGPIFAWEDGMGEYPLLTVNIIEQDLWKPYYGQRSDVAYWVGKGRLDPTHIPEGAIEISRYNFRKRSELAERIRTLDYLISFDPFTAVNVEAVISGTPVLIQGQHDRMSNQQIIDHGWTPYGIAWSIDELDKARKEVHLAYDHYQSLLPIFAKRIDNFVEITQNHFS
jgi:hypothetical protein